jgi:uncharacterized membrane protein YciS (DUF1049 family)
MDIDNLIVHFFFMIGAILGFGIAIIFFDKTEVKISTANKPIRMEIIKTDNKIDTIHVYKLK